MWASSPTINRLYCCYRVFFVSKTTPQSPSVPAPLASGAFLNNYFNQSRLSARSVLLTSSKVSPGHPHPLTRWALPNLSKQCRVPARYRPVNIYRFVGLSSFERRNISMCLSLTREVARRYAVTERENKEQYCKINSIILWLPLVVLSDIWNNGLAFAKTV